MRNGNEILNSRITADGTPGASDRNTWHGNAHDVNEASPACAGKNGTAVRGAVSADPPVMPAS